MINLEGQFVVTDPNVCHGQPTFRGTRIMVRQVLEMVAEEMSWDEIVKQCHHGITKDAIAEAVTLASHALNSHAGQQIREVAA